MKAMNGQYLCNRQITVSYAFKKDTKGERHGTPAGEFCLLGGVVTLYSAVMSFSCSELRKIWVAGWLGLFFYLRKEINPSKV